MKSVITCDMEGRVLTMNDDAVKIFGYKKEEIIGKKRVSIFSPGEIVIQNVGNWLATADKLGEFVGKTYFLKKDGTKINAKISIRPTFADGKSNAQTGYCGVTEVIDEDVTVPINLSTKIIKGVAITRVPFTSASIFPMLAIAAYYAGLGDGLFSVTSLLLAVFGVLLLHLSSNVFNDYFDVSDGTDEANNEYFQPGGAAITGGSRAIELGIITLNKTKTVATSLLLASLLVAGFLFYNIYQVTGATSNVEGALAVGLSGLFLGYFYTARPLRLVARRGLGELAIFLAFGPLLTLGTGYAISAETIGFLSSEFYMLLSLGVPFGFLTTNILYINQFPDAESDAKTGKNHLVVTLGKKAARWGYLVILSLAFYSSVYLNDLLNVHENFNSNVFLVGNAVLYLFGLSIFMKLLKNYQKRELVNANIQTIILQTLFCVFYIISLNLFFI
ncbi:MAG: UbiA family prenyltransferase [Bacteroidota bacterium]|nr:UbiA family prenyltransferase [Bacteroidota bacterium]MEC8679053.1 UbiA family prenyltransferase [Bacteroidota bacterium]MEC8702122.1 UbiA family prenyltransferase [Bacteroidota bacterium]|tara:strand:+ start:492 stop:1829 length:1338 start_codon:yes stop_codon:yes gene_type:complete